MDDKQKVAWLYDYMSVVESNIGVVQENLASTIDCIRNNFLVDERMIENDNIISEKSNLSNVKSSLRYDVIDYLRQNL